MLKLWCIVFYEKKIISQMHRIQCVENNEHNKLCIIQYIKYIAYLCILKLSSDSRPNDKYMYQKTRLMFLMLFYNTTVHECSIKSWSLFCILECLRMSVPSFLHAWDMDMGCKRSEYTTRAQREGASRRD